MSKIIFANNLKKLRKQKNLTQEQLAEKCGVARQTISKWEGAYCEPRISMILVLCKIFSLSANELLYGTKTNSN